MILSVANIKGGTGKSCIAQNLSVGLNRRGLSVLLVDADPQKTTHDWYVNRTGGRGDMPLADVKVVYLPAEGEGTNLAKELLALEQQFDCVVVDCGGHDSLAMRYALSVASFVLIPFRPKRRDLAVIFDVMALLKNASKVNPEIKYRSVITQCPPLPSQVGRILEAKDICRDEGLEPLDSVIFTRNSYDDSEEDGLTVYESRFDEKAIDEMESLVDELMKE